MNDKSLQIAFVEALTSKIPKKSKLAELVAETLCVEKETAYRRLRGEVHFTLREAAILAGKLQISLDDTIRRANTTFSPGEKITMGIPVDYLIETYDKTQILDIMKYLELLVTEPNSEHGVAKGHRTKRK